MTYTHATIKRGSNPSKLYHGACRYLDTHSVVIVVVASHNGKRQSEGDCCDCVYSH